MFVNGLSEAQKRLQESGGTLPWPNKTDWIAKNLIEYQIVEEVEEQEEIGTFDQIRAYLRR
jgi:hypothetical protein